MTPERSLLPELPQSCVNHCPRLSHITEGLEKLGLLSDMALSGVTTEPELMTDLPDELVYLIGEMTDEDLNPSIEADRARALQLSLESAGEAFETFQELSSKLEDHARKITNQCEGNGPLKARINSNYGRVIVGLCKADLSKIDCPHDHVLPASVKLETP